jgi:hypothetical protein
VSSSIALASQARALLFLHAAVSVVLIGASTHHALVALAALRGTHNPRLTRIYTRVVAVAYSGAVALGALSYPAYRYHVRGLYLDRYAPWASNLFDMKENFAAIGLPLVFAALILHRYVDEEENRPALLAYAVAVFFSTAIVWFNFAAGLLVTMERSV